MSKAVEKLGKQRQHLKALRLAATQVIINSPEWRAVRDSRYRKQDKPEARRGN